MDKSKIPLLASPISRSLAKRLLALLLVPRLMADLVTAFAPMNPLSPTRERSLVVRRLAGSVGELGLLRVRARVRRASLEDQALAARARQFFHQPELDPGHLAAIQMETEAVIAQRAARLKSRAGRLPKSDKWE